jgi:hypothetical protein
MDLKELDGSEPSSRTPESSVLAPLVNCGRETDAINIASRATKPLDEVDALGHQLASLSEGGTLTICLKSYVYEPGVSWRDALCSHSFNFDHRRRPETLRTAIATAFF